MVGSAGNFYKIVHRRLVFFINRDVGVGWMRDPFRNKASSLTHSKYISGIQRVPCATTSESRQYQKPSRHAG